MGCDIHAFIEIKKEGRWRFTKELDIDRSYWLFGNLAGVRDESQKPIASPRGLPDDCSQAIRDLSEQWGDDGHSHSFVAWSEIEAHTWVYDGNPVPMRKQFWVMQFADAIEIHGEGNARLVFWFDN